MQQLCNKMNTLLGMERVTENGPEFKIKIQ